MITYPIRSVASIFQLSIVKLQNGTKYLFLVFNKYEILILFPYYILLQSHTILLIQPESRPETRTYSDYESVNECMEGKELPLLWWINIKCFTILGICKIYETHLKKLNPNVRSISYDMSELFEFIDHLSDLSCLVYVNNIILYYKSSISTFINYRLCLGFKEIPRHMPHSTKSG